MKNQERENNKQTQTNRIAVIIPCYNVGNRLEKAVSPLTQFPVDIYVVDDGSTDNCIDSIIHLPVSIISFPENRGKGFAIIEGLKNVLNNPQYEAICFMDADGQHDPNLLPLFLEAWEKEKKDLIIGQRDFKSEKVPLASKFGNYLMRYILHFLTGCPLTDTQCGFRLYSRSFAEEIVAKVEPGRYETETWIIILALHKKKSIGTIPIPSIYEEKNPSSHFRKIYDSLRILKTMFSISLKLSRQK
ncbi:MAG TPA: glycosyltransferase family 2 protein [Candidatus Hydrogenedens sp.]|nr:glycosyltransferase family 2 protein [Candidatus Hydrogenedens sp.]